MTDVGDEGGGMRSEIWASYRPPSEEEIKIEVRQEKLRSIDFRLSRVTDLVSREKLVKHGAKLDREIALLQEDCHPSYSDPWQGSLL